MNMDTNIIGTKETDANFLVMSDAEVSKILKPSMARGGVADAFACHAEGQFFQPLKPYIYPKGRDQMFEGGRFIAMPAFAGPPVNMVGVKWIGSMPANVDRGQPRASGVLVLNDPITALPVVVMQCMTLSARRTAAVAGLAVKRLAPPGPLRIAIIGAGPVAREVLFAIGDFIHDVEVVHVFDLRLQRAVDLGIDIRANTTLIVNTCMSAEECVRGANVIITATTGAKGYLKLAWLSAPWLVIPLSLDDCEPEVLLAADKVVCDDWDQSNREEKLLHQLTQAGKFARTDLYAEFGQIVIGRIPGREDFENIYANFMGMAVVDVAVGARVFRAVNNNS